MYDVTYTYTYDGNGNILSVSDGTNTTSYVYDSANQLIRENNQAAGKTWTWTYDKGGNITCKTEYAYTTGDLGEAVETLPYTYYTGSWRDLLTVHDGRYFTYDECGNLTNRANWVLTWEHGRQLASIRYGNTTWTHEHNADGLRTYRSDGTTTYTYVYNGSTLSQMTVNGNVLYFVNDTVTYNGVTYYYVKNLQGDIIAILDASGNAVVEYTYNAWGVLLSTTGSMASTLGLYNPLRYRGYVYDPETALYYLQSRYYDPDVGRFISPEPNVDYGEFDEAAGLLGYNVYAYCANNPVMYADYCGESITLTVCGVTLGIKGIIALVGTITAATALTAYTTSPTVRNAWNDTVSSAVSGIKSGLKSLARMTISTVSYASTKARSISKSIFDSFAKAQAIPKYRSPRETHHIVAQRAPNAKLARNILDNVDIGYNSSHNLVSLKTGLHRRLHTNAYYGWANSIIISAYNAADGIYSIQRSNVIGALNTIRAFLLSLDAVVPY